MALNYDLKIILPASAVSVFEDVFSEIAGAILTVLLETGPDKGHWEMQMIFEGQPAADMIKILMQKAAQLAHIPVPDYMLQAMPDKNWLQESYQSFQPMTIGRYFIYGSHIHDKIPADKIPLRIDAATAFGTGEHQTTHGCLLALNELDIKPACVLDVGCGSGILAMAYAKTFQRPVDAVDIDEESVRVALCNARDNGVENLVHVWRSDGYQAVSKQYDLIFCNILARPLMNMASDLKAHLTVGGEAILSGFLVRQERWVLKAHTDIGLRFVRRYRIRGWSTLVVARES